MSKQERTLDVVSSMDEEIVERNLTKRIILWANRKKAKKAPKKGLIISLTAAAACLCIIVGAILLFGGTGSDGKQVPVYRGMTVSNDAPDSSTVTADQPAANAGIALLSERTYQLVSGEISMDELTTEDFDKVYYALKNEDIYIHIHLSNPDDFEILSFTLNGKKYSSNMFEDGSDLQTIILKYNVGDVDGLQEYTIDAIKYVDGSKIKDVKMEGNKTVQVLVTDDSAPLKLNASVLGWELHLDPTFTDDFAGEKVITSLALYSGTEKIRDLDTDTRVVTDMPGGRLILKATYMEAGEEQVVQYIFDAPHESEGLQITDGMVSGIGTCTDTVLYINTPIADSAMNGGGGSIDFVTEVYLGPKCTYVGEGALSAFKNVEILAVQGKSVELGISALSCGAREVILPSDLTEIPEGLFYGSTRLESITIPEGVTSIGSDAFNSCSSLKSITIPNSVIQFGDGVFNNCTSLESVNILNDITTIGGFAGCTSLTSITIPDSVTSIGVEAFYECTSLESITIPDSVTSIDYMAFYGCTSLTSITIPSSVTEIGASAFEHCTSLKSVSFNCKITSIADALFNGCTSLTSVTIPSSVTSIGGAAFSDCTALTSITIPDSVTSIGGYAFFRCTGLSSITIPGNVTELGDELFKWCSESLSIRFSGTVDQWRELWKGPIEDGNGIIVHCSDGDVSWMG